jgi:hypothetical protein
MDLQTYLVNSACATLPEYLREGWSVPSTALLAVAAVQLAPLLPGCVKRAVSLCVLSACAATVWTSDAFVMCPWGLGSLLDRWYGRTHLLETQSCADEFMWVINSTTQFHSSLAKSLADGALPARLLLAIALELALKAGAWAWAARAATRACTRPRPDRSGGSGAHMVNTRGTNIGVINGAYYSHCNLVTPASGSDMAARAMVGVERCQSDM